MTDTEPTQPKTSKSYVVRNGRFKGKNLHTLSKADLRLMVDDIPKDEDAKAGIRMMHWMLDNNYPPETFVGFVEWGQNILDTTGKITHADFSADPDETPNTTDENRMLRAARPDVLTRRNLLLGVPSALIATFSFTRLLLGGLKYLIEQEQQDAKQDDPPKKEQGRIARLSDAINNFSSTPVEILGIATLLYEVVDIVKEYEPQKFDQISNAVAKIADDMGIGDPTPTYRLPPRSSGGRAL
jgi:hypothetical protein